MTNLTAQGAPELAPVAPESPAEPPSEQTVPWPMVDAYAGGAASGGVVAWLEVRLGDGPELTEFVRRDLAAEPVGKVELLAGMVMLELAKGVEVANGQSLYAIAPAAPAEPDMRAVCDALGFDPTNHHNAAKCPYCRPSAAEPVPVEAVSEDTKLLDALKLAHMALQQVGAIKPGGTRAVHDAAVLAVRAAIDAARVSAGEAQS